MSYVEPAGAADRGPVPAPDLKDDRIAPLEQLKPFWQQFRRLRDPLGREELLIAYRYLVDDVLAAIPLEGLAPVELASLERRAVRGLGDAIERYPDDGELERFPAHATTRVRAAVTDGLERLDYQARMILRRNPLDAALAARRSRDEHPAGREVAGREVAGREVAMQVDHASISWASGRAPATAAPGSAAARLEEERAPFRSLARTVGLSRSEKADPSEPDPADQVRAALRRLPEQQRTVLTLEFLAGLSLEQVGALLGTSVIGARRASEHALGTLRRAIEEDAGPLAAQVG